MCNPPPKPADPTIRIFRLIDLLEFGDQAPTFAAGTLLQGGAPREGRLKMARDTTDFRPIEKIDELADYLAEGSKPRDKWRIGTEHEKFPFYVDGHAPVPYAGK